MIPNIIHFVFGMAEDFEGKPFPLSHYLAVKSAAVVNQPQKIYFHYQFKTAGKWWEKAKPFQPFYNNDCVIRQEEKTEQI